MAQGRTVISKADQQNILLVNLLIESTHNIVHYGISFCLIFFINTLKNTKPVYVYVVEKVIAIVRNWTILFKIASK